MGEQPGVVGWTAAAKYLGVGMFDLLARPDARWWRAMALACQNAEILSEADRNTPWQA